MLPIAQGSALGERRPRLIHSAFLRLRKNATRRKRVTHYALNATRGVAPHKAGCSYRARHFNQCNIVPPGRCPGLSAAIGLTARHTCAANAVKSWINFQLAHTEGVCNTMPEIVFIIPKQIFPSCLIIFIVCAEKVCYKLCNMYYKVCNMC